MANANTSATPVLAALFVATSVTKIPTAALPPKVRHVTMDSTATVSTSVTERELVFLLEILARAALVPTATALVTIHRELSAR